jgi:Cdc6-like AAA superfamily ATPase
VLTCADGGVLYICGVPGTGKTALVMEMLRELRSEALQAGAQVVAINCLQLPTPQHVFSRLWEKLSGQHLGPARWVATDSHSMAAGLQATPLLLAWCLLHALLAQLRRSSPFVGRCGPHCGASVSVLWCSRACEALMQSFGISGSGASRRRNYSTIIVLDEIDMLMTRDQAVSDLSMHAHDMCLHASGVLHTAAGGGGNSPAQAHCKILVLVTDSLLIAALGY